MTPTNTNNLNKTEENTSVAIKSFKKHRENIDLQLNHWMKPRLGQFLFAYMILSEDEKKFIYSWFEYTIIKVIINSYINPEWVIENSKNEIKTLVSNILNAEKNFDFKWVSDVPDIMNIINEVKETKIRI